MIYSDSTTRFKPGRSGNPTGRPKGSKNRKPALNEERLKTIILEEAYRTIKVNDGPRQVTVPMAQAVVRSLAHNAVKGNTRAQRLFSEMVTQLRRRTHEGGVRGNALIWHDGRPTLAR